MRTLINLPSKITFIALLVPVAGVSAMEYGDAPQSSVVGVWLYEKLTSNKSPVKVAAVSKPQDFTGLFKDQIPVAAATPSMPFGEKIALSIAGGALTLWAVRTMFKKPIQEQRARML